eukprot:6204521-Pleurochrysis_carterae.AAC.2
MIASIAETMHALIFLWRHSVLRCIFWGQNLLRRGEGGGGETNFTEANVGAGYRGECRQEKASRIGAERSRHDDLAAPKLNQNGSLVNIFGVRAQAVAARA